MADIEMRLAEPPGISFNKRHVLIGIRQFHQNALLVWQLIIRRAQLQSAIMLKYYRLWRVPVYHKICR